MRQESNLEQRIEDIQRHFRKTLPARFTKIEDLWHRLQAGWCNDLAQRLYSEIHCLYGCCGTLGMGPLSEVACELQVKLKEAMERECLPEANIRTRITELVTALSGSSGCKPESIRVMVVEDDQQLASSYSASLHEAGILVRVTSPASATGAAQEFLPDLILLDLTKAPRFNIADALRDAPCLAGIPTVSLEKPESTEYLIELIRRHMEAK